MLTTDGRQMPTYTISHGSGELKMNELDNSLTLSTS